MPESTSSRVEPSQPSLSLVGGLRLGQQDAWEKLVELYAPLVRSWCLHAKVPEHRIPDLLQEVFLSVHRSIDRFSPEESTAGFRGWIWTITRNKIRDHYRGVKGHAEAVGGSNARATLQNVADTAPELPDEAPSDATDTSSLLRRAMEIVKVDFRESTWDAFWRATALGQSNEQIAEELNLNPAAVRQAKSRVLRRLRQQLGDLP